MFRPTHRIAYPKIKRASYFIHYRLAWRYNWARYLKGVKKADRFRKKKLFQIVTGNLAAWAVEMKAKRGEEAEVVKYVPSSPPRASTLLAAL